MSTTTATKQRRRTTNLCRFDVWLKDVIPIGTWCQCDVIAMFRIFLLPVPGTWKGGKVLVKKRWKSFLFSDNGMDMYTFPSVTPTDSKVSRLSFQWYSMPCSLQMVFKRYADVRHEIPNQGMTRRTLLIEIQNFVSVRTYFLNSLRTFASVSYHHM